MRGTSLAITIAAGLVSAGVAFGADDTKAPELRSLSFAPTAIDTSASAAEVTISFTLADDVSGVTYVEASFLDPSGTARQSASAKFAPVFAGTYSARVAFPRFSNPGAWTLSQVFLSDAAGNTLALDANGLGGRGFPTRLEVKSAHDTTSPKLTGLDFSSREIDTSLGPAAVRLNYAGTDDLSGVSYLELSFVSPSGVTRQGGSVKFEAAALSVSNSIVVNFPRQSEAGRWTLSTVFLSDAAGNTLVLDAEKLKAMGFQTVLDVKSVLDTTPPSLASLRFAPDTIDTSQGSATVDVSFRATDAMSGVKSLQVVFESPSGVGKQAGFATFPSLNGVSDSVKVTFPRLSEPGRWTLSSVFLADAAGNTLALDADGLAGMGVRTGLDVRSAQDTLPPNLTALRFTPDIIDTSRGAAVVEVGFTATDNFSGVKSFEVFFASPSGGSKHGNSVVFSPKTEVTGTLKVDFPQSSERGKWIMETAVLTDAAGNTLVLDADALASRVRTLQVR